MRRNAETPDLTPMIDVTFLILIFFMVTASFSLQRAIQMPHPTSQHAGVRPIDHARDPVRLHVDQQGSFFLMATDWQQSLVGKQSLITALINAKSRTDLEPDLRIEVDSSASLQSLVDAMDAAAIAGFGQVQLTEVDAEFI